MAVCRILQVLRTQLWHTAICNLLILQGIYYIMVKGSEAGMEVIMPGYLIKDTTVSERIALVKQWEEDEGCENCGIDPLIFYKDYMDGKKEISQINAEYNARYVTEIPDDEGMGCGMGNRR